jgi:hypothetical protein
MRSFRLKRADELDDGESSTASNDMDQDMHAAATAATAGILRLTRFPYRSARELSMLPMPSFLIRVT